MCPDVLAFLAARRSPSLAFECLLTHGEVRISCSFCVEAALETWHPSWIERLARETLLDSAASSDAQQVAHVLLAGLGQV